MRGAAVVLVVVTGLAGGAVLGPIVAFVRARLSRSTDRAWARASRWWWRAVVLALTGAVVWALPDPGVPVLLVFTALNLLLREEFPFSHFPMYAVLSQQAFYVRVTDGGDRSVPLGQAAFLATKIYARERRRVGGEMGVPEARLSPEDLRGAADRVFRYLDACVQGGRTPPLPATVRVYEVVLSLGRGRVVETQRLVGERCSP